VRDGQAAGARGRYIAGRRVVSMMCATHLQVIDARMHGGKIDTSLKPTMSERAGRVGPCTRSAAIFTPNVTKRRTRSDVSDDTSPSIQLISAGFALMLGWLTDAGARDRQSLPRVHGYRARAVLATVGGVDLGRPDSCRRIPLAAARPVRAARTQTRCLSRSASRSAVMLFVLHAHVAIAAPFVLGALTEGQHAGEFIIGERPDGGSREKRHRPLGQNLKAGAVVGRVSRGIGRVSVPAVVGTGNGTMSQVFAGPDVQVGNYVLTCTAAVADGGVFSVVAPDGTALPSLTMTPGAGGTTKYRGRHINFTITDGGTNFAVGDIFTFVVSTTAPTVQGGTGTGTVSALALGPDAEPGNYRLICITAVTNGGVFQLFRGGPDGGISLGQYTLTPGSGGSTTFESRHFTLHGHGQRGLHRRQLLRYLRLQQLNGGKVVAWDPTTFDGSHLLVGHPARQRERDGCRHWRAC
jgi:hypothetical protein